MEVAAPNGLHSDETPARRPTAVPRPLASSARRRVSYHLLSAYSFNANVHPWCPLAKDVPTNVCSARGAPIIASWRMEPLARPSSSPNPCDWQAYTPRLAALLCLLLCLAAAACRRAPPSDVDGSSVLALRRCTTTRCWSFARDKLGIRTITGEDALLARYWTCLAELASDADPSAAAWCVELPEWYEEVDSYAGNGELVVADVFDREGTQHLIAFRRGEDTARLVSKHDRDYWPAKTSVLTSEHVWLGVHGDAVAFRFPGETGPPDVLWGRRAGPGWAAYRRRAGFEAVPLPGELQWLTFVDGRLQLMSQVEEIGMGLPWPGNATIEAFGAGSGLALFVVRDTADGAGWSALAVSSGAQGRLSRSEWVLGHASATALAVDGIVGVEVEPSDLRCVVVFSAQAELGCGAVSGARPRRLWFAGMYGCRDGRLLGWVDSLCGSASWGRLGIAWAVQWQSDAIVAVCRKRSGDQPEFVRTQFTPIRR